MEEQADMTERQFVDGQREAVVTRSKRKKSESVPTLVSSHESACTVASSLISMYHHELASANIVFLCTNKDIKGIGGKVSKATPLIKYLVDLREVDADGEMVVPAHLYVGDENREEVDFIVMIALPTWNAADERKRTAIVDHILTRCHVQEDAESGKLKFSLRDPEVQVFPEVVERHGAYEQKLDELRDCLVEN